MTEKHSAITGYTNAQLIYFIQRNHIGLAHGEQRCPFCAGKLTQGGNACDECALDELMRRGCPPSDAMAFALSCQDVGNAIERRHRLSERLHDTMLALAR